MAENKTKQTNASVEDFLNGVENEQKRADCFEISKMMTDVTKEPAKMWGGSIVGFGSYHYKYDSGREGDSCLAGFSPRKANIVLYMMGAVANNPELLQKLGKYKSRGGCVYINKLSDVDKSVLKSLIKESVSYVRKKYK
jgi:hypothetical protein